MFRLLTGKIDTIILNKLLIQPISGSIANIFTPFIIPTQNKERTSKFTREVIIVMISKPVKIKFIIINKTYKLIQLIRIVFNIFLALASSGSSSHFCLNKFIFCNTSLFACLFKFLPPIFKYHQISFYYIR